MHSRQLIVAAVLLIGATRVAVAQHEGHQMPAKKPPSDTMSMSMDGPLGIPMERMGSGTTWIPDALILPSRHWMRGKWMVMLHGFVWAQYDQQGGPRGSGQFGSLN